MISPVGKITGFPCQKCGTSLVQTPTARLYCPRCEQLRIMGEATQQVQSLNSKTPYTCQKCGANLEASPTVHRDGLVCPQCSRRKEYRVTWCIDIDADSPEEAVRAVWQRYFHHGHTASVFEVDGVDYDMEV